MGFVLIRLSLFVLGLVLLGEFRIGCVRRRYWLCWGRSDPLHQVRQDFGWLLLFQHYLIAAYSLLGKLGGSATVCLKLKRLY